MDCYIIPDSDAAVWMVMFLILCTAVQMDGDISEPAADVQMDDVSEPSAAVQMMIFLSLLLPFR